VGLVGRGTAADAFRDVENDRDARAIELVAQGTDATLGAELGRETWNSTATRKQSSLSQSRNGDAPESPPAREIGIVCAIFEPP